MSEEDRAAERFFVITKIFSLIEKALKYGSIIACSYIGYLTIGELAGRETDATLALFLDLATKEKKTLLPWVLVLACAIWAYVERDLRLRKIAYFHDQNKKLEKILDDKRSSSNLTKNGLTNPKDKL